MPELEPGTLGMQVNHSANRLIWHGRAREWIATSKTISLSTFVSWYSAGPCICLVHASVCTLIEFKIHHDDINLR